MRISPIKSYYNYQGRQISSYKEASTSDISFKSKTLNKKFSNIFKKPSSYFWLVIAAITATAVAVAPGKWADTKKARGYIEPLQEHFETKEDAINYAINRIKEPLNYEEPKEYGVLIDYNNYDIVSERLGTANSVNSYPLIYVIKDKLNIEHPYISLHGHPIEVYKGRVATQSFSLQDFKVFAREVNEKEAYVVNKNGQYCMFRKKEGFITPTEEEFLDIEKEYNFNFHYCWANRVNVYKDGKVVHTFDDYQGMHAFWKSLADKYNFEYYTNYGVYDGIDAYIDYYYPDLTPPKDPTSHKNFKL